ncbi:hypothetical protein NADFUDRAFT_19430 [Nadsonia fulvescens var. elongata DSM 6958]|uniref:MFS general substrate transporter n=1 Tax=Nadsonia fulvescens var. elongata DSM 6958 TaxID=857566 RepID=A0A1E3PQW5_9ASCO|nr:hypothetical protein NADFUDRAFT_19430 [Nadsonia fulvescens var. elongata DSM 6958]
MSDHIELVNARKRTAPSSPSLPVASSNWAESAWKEEPAGISLSSSGRGYDEANSGNDRVTGSSLSLSELSIKDQKNFFLLAFLYLLQGIPVGLAFGSIPFLLKSKLSYGQVGIFTLASYPYSLKLLWSPIVDAIYHPKFGRRKSWIVPIQLVSSILLIWLGSAVEPLLEEPEINLARITFLFFMLVFLAATQDIAVDGWALTLLSHESLSYASTAQTIGLNTGYFLSFTVFLAFNSPEFANKYFRTLPLDTGLVSLSGYLIFWGWVYLLMTALVGVFKNEGRMKGTSGSILDVYKSMYKVVSLKNVQSFILVHILAKVGFQANEAVTNLKLLEKGFSKEDLALTVLIDFPFEIVFGYYAAKWSTGRQPLKPWMQGFMGRLMCAVLAMLVVHMFPKIQPGESIGLGYLLVVIFVHVLGSFMSTVQFVSINAFHTQIADPAFGGTYMTTLNTISNLGGQWPRIIVLYAVDYFTMATCKNDVAPFSCTTDAAKKMCTTKGGVCEVIVDGYYITNWICIIIGSLIFFGWIKQKMEHLQRLPISSWRIAS